MRDRGKGLPLEKGQKTTFLFPLQSSLKNYSHLFTCGPDEISQDKPPSLAPLLAGPPNQHGLFADWRCLTDRRTPLESRGPTIVGPDRQMPHSNGRAVLVPTFISIATAAGVFSTHQTYPHMELDTPEHQDLRPH
jgi:hypothetical protein